MVRADVDPVNLRDASWCKAAGVSVETFLEL